MNLSCFRELSSVALYSPRQVLDAIPNERTVRIPFHRGENVFTSITAKRSRFAGGMQIGLIVFAFTTLLLPNMTQGQVIRAGHSWRSFTRQMPNLIPRNTKLTESADEADVVVYGGTSGGVAAAVQVRRMGHSVILIEPSQHLGGLTSGGLGATDIGNKAAIGGISREFYQRVREYYAKEEAWVHEQSSDYRSSRFKAQDDAMWTFEPHVAELIMDRFVKEVGVTVVRGERLNREDGVIVNQGRIVSIEMESGRTFKAEMFIDTTYEGDLMAAAGVSYHVGREANSTYDETLNGVQTRNAVFHQFAGPVDPFVKAGDSTSGFLPGIDPEGPGEEGSGDDRVQAYCFRMCVTDVKSNQIPFEKPDDYDPLQYELLFRNFEAGADRAPWNPILMPNRKTDANNNRGVSTDYIGMSYAWPEADYATRQAIYQQHLSYQKGLMWTLANHPRVPERFRQEFSRWGNCRDEFQENHGWSHQIYVREGRRMVSDYVMTQHNCQGRTLCDDPVGLAAYTMDSHNVQRYVDSDGHVRNEGDVQVGGFPPYPISYRSIVPKRDEVHNLFVPICLSASHIAYGSIRMEPVFMVLGQSAGTAACFAIEQSIPVQDLEYETLHQRLINDQQVLAWTPSPSAAVSSIDPDELVGVVVDESDAKTSPGWSFSRSIGGFVGRGYLHDGDQAKGERTITYRATAKVDGDYDLRLAYTANPNRATNVPVTVRFEDHEELIRLNQRNKPPIIGSFVSLGEYFVPAGQTIVVTLSNKGTDGHVIGDALWLAPIDD